MAELDKRITKAAWEAKIAEESCRASAESEDVNRYHVAATRAARARCRKETLLEARALMIGATEID